MTFVVHACGSHAEVRSSALSDHSSLSAQRNILCLAIQNALTQDSDQTARMLTCPKVSFLTLGLERLFLRYFLSSLMSRPFLKKVTIGRYSGIFTKVDNF